ncbi:hypothetical protein LINPERPRIM_LOCUS16160 [Linum perenne]
MSSSGASKSGRRPPRKNPNAPGNRSDPGWQYALDVDGTAKKTQCKFCLKVFSGGIFRLKHHLAGTRDNVEACVSVPDDVRKKVLELLDFNLEAKEVRKNLLSTRSLSSAASGSGSQDIPHSRVDVSGSSSTQTIVSQLLKRDQRKEACKGITQWFYKTATALNGARCEEYYRMFDLVARHGPGFKPPSYHEIRETFLQEEKKELDEKLGHFRDEWKSLDTSNFSKNASKVFEMLDNVVEKVGEENVIQIVTDNAAAYKAAGTKLMEKRKHLFWTPCAAHCFDLMLEDFDKNLKVHKSTIEKGRKITNFIYASTILISMLREFTTGHDLVRPGATRIATTYLNLACLSEHKGALMTMFSSDAWKKGSFSNIPKGKSVQGIVLDGRFWSNVSLCIRAALPLVKVLRLVDSEEYPSMPFLYFELLQAKEKIKLNFNNNERRYIIEPNLLIL